LPYIDACAWVALSPGYYTTETFDTTQDPSLPDNTVVAVGYSIWALLALIIVSCVLVCIPVALVLPKLPGEIVNVGCNFFAISAACDVSSEGKFAAEAAKSASLASDSTFVLPAYTSPTRGSVELDQDDGAGGGGPWARSDGVGSAGHNSDCIEMLPLSQEDGNSPLTREEVLELVSQSRIRWGIVQMPPDFYSEYHCAESAQYEHLGFGVEGEDITLLVYGNYYA
jgi:hypothetical protein